MLKKVATGRTIKLCVQPMSKFDPSSYDAESANPTSFRYPRSHGTPVHIGNPHTIGVKNLSKPDAFDLGTASPQKANEIVMFWGCGVTPQAVAMEENTLNDSQCSRAYVHRRPLSRGDSKPIIDGLLKSVYRHKGTFLDNQPIYFSTKLTVLA